ncbi:MAG: 23S rRNA (pseudouridine(1915)-N(3))-methyltransferase RlmH [Gemmatimonadota bacterium]
MISVGRPAALLRDAIAAYEARAARYWPLEVAHVKAEPARGGVPIERVLQAEGERLLGRVAEGAEVVVLTRGGRSWDSPRLAAHLRELSVRSHPGAAFLIGGAAGLDQAVLARADRQLRISSFTLAHDVARLVLAEQLYRAGTIARGEPYHRGPA